MELNFSHKHEDEDELDMKTIGGGNAVEKESSK
jgi:hypothetical protein